MSKIDIGRLAGYVRKKVKRRRNNNASEVVREALRRMEDEDVKAIRLARPTAEDVLSDLTAQQLEDIRWRVRASIDSVEAGECREYEERREPLFFHQFVEQGATLRLGVVMNPVGVRQEAQC